MLQLGLSIIAAIITAFGVLIAARQMRIADEKFKLDVFDRQYDKRFAVYEATRKILQSVILHKVVPDNEINSYGFITLDVNFCLTKICLSTLENFFKELRCLIRRSHYFSNCRRTRRGERGSKYAPKI